MDDEVFQVSVFGTADLIARLQKLAGFFTSPRLRAILEDAKSAYVTQARLAVVKKSRFLSRSIDGSVEGFGTDNPRIIVFSSAKYAASVEFGAKAHPIYPVQRSWLHWFEDGSGKTVDLVWGLKNMPPGLHSEFRRVAQHPGNAAQPFFFRWVPIIRDRLTAALIRAVDEALGKQET